MNHVDYEALVRDVVHEFTAVAEGLGQCKVTGGAQNRVAGASGFAHQIDVAVRRSTDLLLVECKYWKDPVDVEPVLVLAARIADVSGNAPGTAVHGSIVSTQEPTAGAKVLAAHFGISINTVLSLHEYALRVFNHFFAGVSDGLNLADSVKIEVVRDSG